MIYLFILKLSIASDQEFSRRWLSALILATVEQLKETLDRLTEELGDDNEQTLAGMIACGI